MKLDFLKFFWGKYCILANKIRHILNTFSFLKWRKNLLQNRAASATSYLKNGTNLVMK